MRDVVLTEASRRAIEAFSTTNAAKFDAILDQIDQMPIALRRAGFIESADWFGLKCERYYDWAFPFMFLFTLVDNQNIIVLHLIMPAFV